MIRIHLLLLSFLLLGVGQTGFTQNVKIPRGSYIVNLGITPQTIGNGLKPYGLVYDLVTNYNVPVMWVFKQSKAKDANDFHHNGVFYKGSAFVIDSLFLTSTVKTRISSYWNAAARGVVGAYTTYDTVLPVYNTITYWPKVVMDQANDQLPLKYYNNAEIPSTSFRVGLPASLTNCEDMYVMPHADPTWANYSPLYNFTRVSKGYVWGNCHAVSVLESTKNPSGIECLNFLTTAGLQCYKANECAPTVTEVHNGAPITPTLDASLSGEPLMQLIGNPIPPTEKGSEEWYIPVTTGSWNADAKQYVYTGDGSGNRRGMKIVSGFAYGNSNYGRVAYEAGHDLTSNGNEAEQVAAQRVFLNFLMLSAIEKKPQILLTKVINSISGNTIFNVTANVSGGISPYTYAWTSNCGAIFSNATGNSTNITLTSPGTCRITLRITDACQRKNYEVLTANTIAGTILPEESLSLSAKRISQAVQLDWSLPLDGSYERFSLERSYDGISFVSIANMPASQNSYSQLDQPDLLKKYAYYRLRGTEKNKPSYSNIVAVKLNNNAVNVRVFPNPVKDFIQLMDLPNHQTVQLSIYGMSGYKLFEKVIMTSDGTYRLPITEAIQKGIYYIQIRTQDSLDIIKLIKEG